MFFVLQIMLSGVKVLTGLIARVPSSCLIPSQRHMRVSPYVFNFWEPDRKGGYKTKIKKPSRELAKEGLKEIRGELSKLKEEISTKFRCDNLELMLHGDYEIVWKFSSEDIVNSWVVTADSDHNEGHSKAGFVLGANQKGIFRGNLNTKVQKDGKVRSAGYCNIRSPKNMV